MAMSVRRLLPVLAALVFATGCGPDTLSLDTVAADSPGVTSSTGSVSLALVGGGTVDPEALSMDTPVALWFWAPG